MSATETKTLNVYGDELEITWNGSAWVSPHNSQQHSSARAAMRAELERYYTDCGENIANKKIAAEIDGFLSHM